MRLRQFTQDDGHIFCTEDQIAAEVERFCRELAAFYRRFGFADVVGRLLAAAGEPARRATPWWDRAEAMLGDVVGAARLAVRVQPGAARSTAPSSSSCCAIAAAAPGSAAPSSSTS